MAKTGEDTSYVYGREKINSRCFMVYFLRLLFTGIFIFMCYGVISMSLESNLFKEMGWLMLPIYSGNIAICVCILIPLFRLKKNDNLHHVFIKISSNL